MSRIVVQINMDVFDVAIEERDAPVFRELPLVVGADPARGQGHGVVSTQNYKAREYGIHSAAPISTAWRLSEEARRRGQPPVTFVSIDMRKYAGSSEAVMAVARRAIPVLEQARIDEAYDDVSDSGSYAAAVERVVEIHVAGFAVHESLAGAGMSVPADVERLYRDKLYPNWSRLRHASRTTVSTPTGRQKSSCSFRTGRPANSTQISQKSASEGIW